jgi:hypothetical protein
MSESVEKIIHDKMAEVAESVWSEHGIRVDQVMFKWEDMKDMDEEVFRIKSISIATTT